MFNEYGGKAVFIEHGGIATATLSVCPGHREQHAGKGSMP
jgi:hypothetical protein